MIWVEDDTPEKLHERVNKIIESHVPEGLVFCVVCERHIDPGQSVETTQGPIHGYPKRCVYRLSSLQH